MATPKCKSIKSVREPANQCNNFSVAGDFCGIHKNSKIYWGGLKDQNQNQAIRKIQNWYKKQKFANKAYLQGPVFQITSKCVNEADFFSTDPVGDIPSDYFFSYKDDIDGLHYGFDIRSFHEYVLQSGEPLLNPYTRSPISDKTMERHKKYIARLKRQDKPFSWQNVMVETPEQAWRMKVIDIFSVLESLEYGSDPQWYLNLDLFRQKIFYVHLMDIWLHRAGLSGGDRNRICPMWDNPQNLLFPKSSNVVLSMRNQQQIKNMNVELMKRLLSSAERRDDKILGAMYILTALTQVSPPAAEAFPWLFYSAYEVADSPVASWIESVLQNYAPMVQL